MNAAPPQPSRTEIRLRAYSRTLRGAFLVTAGLHLIGAVATNPLLILRLFIPQTMLGYPGASRPGDLGPEGGSGRHDVSIIRSRRLAGPSTLIHLEVQGDAPGPPSGQAALPAAGSGQFEPVAAPSPRGAGSGGNRSGVHFELDENWAVIGGSGNVARSERFQALKIVRPEYPRVAIRAGVEGLVRLEVQVDTTGRVVGVRTDANTSSSRELEDAAIHAMLEWVFKPYREKAKPVPFTLMVPFRYRLVD